uniref:Uncharacterized protein n=1 Tax=Rangifer tarandus platyrhynchus TaxID=3082113 RepID=A0ACB0EVD2_RANTA|nr:unnamed protein product [Rangifer tarandus platyrhynchus]
MDNQKNSQVPSVWHAALQEIPTRGFRCKAILKPSPSPQREKGPGLLFLRGCVPHRSSTAGKRPLPGPVSPGGSSGPSVPANLRALTWQVGCPKAHKSWVWPRAGKQEVRCPAPRPAGPPPRPPPAPPVPRGAALWRARAARRIVRSLPGDALSTLLCVLCLCVRLHLLYAGETLGEDGAGGADQVAAPRGTCQPRGVAESPARPENPGPGEDGVAGELPLETRTSAGLFPA